MNYDAKQQETTAGLAVAERERNTERESNARRESAAMSESAAERASAPEPASPAPCACTPPAADRADATAVTFSFGENWAAYVRGVTEESIAAARADVVEWLGPEGVRGRSVLDIGCGSGIHSLCFQRLGAARVVSFDLDEHSAAATCALRARAGNPPNWDVRRGSVLDAAYMAGLGAFDVVYSWGVLHHTGRMWEAVGRAAERVAPGGRLWIALYAAGPHYAEHLRLKQRYNRASWLGKRLILWWEMLRVSRWRLHQGRNPFIWHQTRARGMTAYHDLIDWLGGLPYEVAGVTETTEFCRRFGLEPDRCTAASEGACSGFLFHRPG